MAQPWLSQLQASNAQHGIGANAQYAQFDANNDNRLSAEELAAACNISVEEAADVIRQYDANGDGYLDPDEFEQLKAQILAQQTELIASHQFSQLDNDGDGRISAAELAAAVNIPEEEAAYIIQQYDPNGDGFLDESEFMDLKQQILDQQQQDNMAVNINAHTQFDQIDADHNGALSATELAQACNIDVEEARAIIYQYDQNGDGLLQPHEFEDLKNQILAQQRADMTNKMGANTQFADIDNDGNNALSAKELAAACGITEMEAQNIIIQFDQNGDGYLQPDEFEQLKQQILQQQRAMAAGAIQQNTSYNQFDTNQDARIDAQEIAQRCNISVQEAHLLIEQFDTDGDGYLDEQEFETLKARVLADQHGKQEEKQEVATYQAQVYNNQQPQMQLTNNSGRDPSNSAFKPYTQLSDKPAMVGDINKVDTAEYHPSNSNAKAFGVDIFANEKKPPQQQYNNNARPFGQAQPQQQATHSNNSSNARPFGQPAAQTAPFGAKPGPNSGNSPFGANPNANKYQAPSAASNDSKPKQYAHKWSLHIKFDAGNQQIILNVDDTATQKHWRKIISKNEVSQPIKQEYFRLGKIIQNGSAKYTYPENGVGAVQVSLTHGNDGFNFAGNPV